jgi:hypothetical protein
VDPGGLQSRGLVRFSVKRRRHFARPLTENTDLTPLRQTLQSSCVDQPPRQAGIKPDRPGRAAATHRRRRERMPWAELLRAAAGLPSIVRGPRRALYPSATSLKCRTLPLCRREVPPGKLTLARNPDPNRPPPACCCSRIPTRACNYDQKESPETRRRVASAVRAAKSVRSASPLDSSPTRNSKDPSQTGFRPVFGGRVAER